MGAVLIESHAQSLTLTAVFDMYREVSTSAYSDAALTTAISLPASLHDGSMIYLHEGSKRLTLVTQLGEEFNERVEVQRTTQTVDIPRSEDLIGGEVLPGSITLSDLAPEVLSRVVNDVTGLSMATVPVTPPAPSDGMRIYTQASKVKYVTANGQGAELLDSNMQVFTLPDQASVIPPLPITGGKYYNANGYLISLGASGTITVIAAP